MVGLRLNVWLGQLMVGVALLVSNQPVLAQTCLEAIEPLLEDTSEDCIGLPSNSKFFEASTFDWGGSSRLAVNTGNEIKLWTLDDPKEPIFAAASAFNVHNQGDSDYDLLSYSFCDDCRFGVAAFKLGIALFDLGTSASPGFFADTAYMTSAEPMGGFTFMVDGQQYLLASLLPDDCGGDATLYRMNGIYEGQFEAIGCINIPYWDLKIVNGFHIKSGEPSVLYLGFSNRRIYTFEVIAGGQDPFLRYVNHGDDVPLANLMRGRGMAVDEAHDLAVAVVKMGEMRIYDIADPANPVLLSSRAGNWGLAAIRYPFVWVADGSVPDSSVSWDISDPANPRLLDPGFWDPAMPWNIHGEDCEWPGGAVFSDDSSTLYFPRYSVVQLIDFESCDAILAGDDFESGDTSGWSRVVW